MIFCPPQIGKSERAVRRFVEWLLDQFPELRIVVASYDKDVAVRWGRRSSGHRGDPELGITLRPTRKAAGRWETAQGGSLYCVGIRGTCPAARRPADHRRPGQGPRRRRVEDDPRRAGTGGRTSPRSARADRRDPDPLAHRRPVRPAARAGAGRVGSCRSPRSPRRTTTRSAARSARRSSRRTRAAPPATTRRCRRRRRPTCGRRCTSSGRPREGGIFKRGDWRYWEPLEHEQAARCSASTRPVRPRPTARGSSPSTSPRRRRRRPTTPSPRRGRSPSAGDLVLLDRVRDRVPEIDHAAFLAPLRQRWLGRTT
jgi:hypothetical protein